jgi:hypothetical protein
MISTRIHERRSSELTFCRSKINPAATHTAPISAASPRAAASALNSACFGIILGVRRHGRLPEKTPLRMASPTVWDSDNPASYAEKACASIARTCVLQRWNTLAVLKMKTERGRSEKTINGGSTDFGAITMAADQPRAARLNSRMNPSVTHGSQPAMK